MTDTQFDAKAARAKRPLPLWVDSFSRDTALLETDEVGAYLKILMAMWSSRSVSLPNDPRKLARAAGVSLRLWNSRVGPSLMGFFSACDEGLTQKRLRKEAAYTEREVTHQSNRKRGKKMDKPLENNDPPKSGDISTDQSPEDPTQQPITYIDGSGSLRSPPPSIARVVVDSDLLRVKVLEVIGVGPDGIVGPSKFIGTQADMLTLEKWQTDLDLSPLEIIATIREVMAAKRDGPPGSFKYFTAAMTRFAAQKAQPKLEPDQLGAPDHERTHGNQNPENRNRGGQSAQSRAAHSLTAAVARVVSEIETAGD